MNVQTRFVSFRSDSESGLLGFTKGSEFFEQFTVCQFQKKDLLLYEVCCTTFLQNVEDKFKRNESRLTVNQIKYEVSGSHCSE